MLTKILKKQRQYTSQARNRVREQRTLPEFLTHIAPKQMNEATNFTTEIRKRMKNKRQKARKKDYKGMSVREWHGIEAGKPL